MLICDGVKYHDRQTKPSIMMGANDSDKILIPIVVACFRNIVKNGELRSLVS